MVCGTKLIVSLNCQVVMITIYQWIFQGLEIKNNLTVKGLLNLGSADISDISGSLRYTDISKVEVWYDSKWNKLNRRWWWFV